MEKTVDLELDNDEEILAKGVKKKGLFYNLIAYKFTIAVNSVLFLAVYPT